jgi:acyl-CoA thioesterase-1
LRLPSRRSQILALSLLLGWVGAAAAGPLEPEDRRCRVPPAMLTDDSPLPATAAAIHAGRHLTIVALGSSSTAGVGASSKQAAYPAILQRELTRQLKSKVTVINRGVGGETIERTASRIGSDVLRFHPELVIWQTGTNDLLSWEPADSFGKVLAAGIQRLRRRGIDVLLMDMQYFPKGEWQPAMTAYLRIIDRVGDRQDVPVIHRHRIMSYWLASGKLSMHQMLSHDLFHMSDEGYQCLGEIVADFILNRTIGYPGAPQPTPLRPSPGLATER